MKNNQKSFILLSTIIALFTMTLFIAGYAKYSISTTSKEFHKDLVKIRGYWAVYGSKELNSSMEYKYYRLSSDTFLYDINTSNTLNGTSMEYRWSIKDDNTSGIKNTDVFKRILEVDASNSDKTLSYKYEGN